MGAAAKSAHAGPTFYVTLLQKILPEARRSQRASGGADLEHVYARNVCVACGLFKSAPLARHLLLVTKEIDCAPHVLNKERGLQQQWGYLATKRTYRITTHTN
eukprot:2526832-Pyramimonas_sp.AAC.1